MRSSCTIHVISAHAEGEVGDVIVGGVAPPPGETLWDVAKQYRTREELIRGANRLEEDDDHPAGMLLIPRAR